jgi:uncharacterized protein (DUF58 family)
VTAEPFPPPFLTMLHQILARPLRVQGARVESARARRRKLSQSGVFAGHRRYVVGDDPRWIDWNAYARSGTYHVKLLEEEERRTATIVLDTSASMTAGSPERRLGALRLCAILGGLALQQLDGLRIQGGRHGLSLAGAGSLSRLLEELPALPASAEAPVQVVPLLLRQGAPGKVVWVSDFAEPASFEPALLLLRRYGCRVVGWLPAIPDDERAPARGWLRLRDPESGREEALFVDEPLARQFALEQQQLRRRQELSFAAAGYPLQRYPLPAADDFAPRSWLEAAWQFRR